MNGWDMRAGRRRVEWRAILLLGLLAWPRDAAAYIDPGTGSLAYQSLIAIVLGVGLFWRQLRSRIAALFRRREPRDGPRPPLGGAPPE